jgi:hypothetical protein
MRFVVEYDHVGFDSPPSQRGIKHHVLRPTSSREEAESCAKNLKLNPRVSNVVIKGKTHV